MLLPIPIKKILIVEIWHGPRYALADIINFVLVPSSI